MMERSQSFDIQEKNYEEILNHIKQILEKKLFFSTTTTKIGNLSLRINYFNETMDEQIQKENKIIILQESERKVNVQIVGQLNNHQITQIWRELEDFLNIPEDSIKVLEVLPSKNEIYEKIKNFIEDKGYLVKNEDVEIFINNFVEHYARLPLESELTAIVKGYIRMVNEENYSNGISEPKLVDSHEKIHVNSQQDSLLNSQEKVPTSFEENNILSRQELTRRRRCPKCGNEGRIREVNDKTEKKDIVVNVGSNGT